MKTNGRYPAQSIQDDDVMSPGSLPHPERNLSESERWASIAGGGALVFAGLMRRDWRGALARLPQRLT